MVQEPALTLIVEAGGGELVNFMDIDQATAELGGAYEFMGVSIRAEDREARQDEMRRMAAALKKGLADTRVNLTAGRDRRCRCPSCSSPAANVDQLKAIIERYRASLYPEAGGDRRRRPSSASSRANEVAGIIEPGSVDLGALLDTADRRRLGAPRRRRIARLWHGADTRSGQSGRQSRRVRRP